MNVGGLVSFRLYHQWRHLRFALVFIFLLGCDKGGTGINQLASNVGAGINPALKVAPIPLEANLSDVSYMSCPMAGANTQVADPLANPVYRFRFGSYDNSALTGGFTSVSGTHVGGIGFSADAVNYLKRADPKPNSNMFSSYLSSSPYTQNANLVATLIYQNRTTDAVAFTALATTFLDNLTGAYMAPILSMAPIASDGGTLKTGYFQTIPSGAKSAIMGSLNWGKSEVDEQNLRAQLFTQYLFLGYAPNTYTDAKSIITNLASPDNDVTKRLFGKGYSLTFLANDPTISTITEWDLNPPNYTGGTVTPVNLTIQQNQSWDCFTMGIVRDADRKYWTVKPALPGACGGVCTAAAGACGPCSDYLPATTVIPIVVDGAQLAPGNIVHPIDVRNSLLYGLIKENRFINSTDIAVQTQTLIDEYTYTNPLTAPSINTNSALLPPPRGMFAACPSEDLTVLTERQKERLRVVRRFLSPDYWDVNITSGCAIPNHKMIQSGVACYASSGGSTGGTTGSTTSGDDDISTIIQYDTTYGPCGPPPLSACQAKVNFCWRFQ